MNADGGSSQTKKPKSTGMAEQGGTEGSDMDEDNMDPNSDEHGRVPTAGLGANPPQPPSDSAFTRAATKASQPSRRPRGKKVASARAASAGPPATEVQPVWFKRALEMLRSVDGGASWTKLLDVWSAFEAQEEYSEVMALSSQNRPWALSQWQKRYRSPTWRPPVEKMVTFDMDFMTWWVGLQPKWRVADGKVVRDLNGDLSDLKRPGLNGLLTVLVGLFYWHITNGLNSEEWLTIVEDCIEIIDNFLH